MANDPLEELLGFNPESGNRLEDRSSLTESRANQAPDAAVREFQNYLDAGPSDPRVISYPEYLTEAFDEDNPIVRVKYVYDPDDILQNADNDYEYVVPPHFQVLSDIEFEERRASAGYKPSRLMVRGENTTTSAFWGDALGDLHPKGEGHLEKKPEMSTLFLYEGGGMTGRFFIDNRDLEVDYGGDRAFESVMFALNDETNNITKFDLSLSKIKYILGSNAETVMSIPNGKVNVKIQGTKLLLNISINNIEKDSISLPLANSQQKVISEILDPVTLKDPFKAPPQYDEKWIKADIAKVLGIEWERK